MPVVQRLLDFITGNTKGRINAKAGNDDAHEEK
jgi:hypothetical protein